MRAEYLVARWRNVRAGLLDTIAKFRDEELDFRPYPTAWSVRQLMLHIAHEEFGEFAHGIVQTLFLGIPLSWSQYDVTSGLRRFLLVVVTNNLRRFGPFVIFGLLYLSLYINSLFP